MKNKKIILIVSIALIFLGVSYLNFHSISKPITELSYTDTIPGSISVYDFMSKLQNEGKITFKDKTYAGMGKLIEEINGLKSTGGKYWIYYVNGVEAQVGVSNYIIKSGDIVSWKYE